LLWPLAAAASAGDAAAAYLDGLTEAISADVHRPRSCELDWTTPNQVMLELATVRLRDFSTHSRGVPALICAPFALHAANIADLAPGHSLVERLRESGVPRVFVTEWRSASEDMRFLSIDNYLADLNVMVDELGEPVDLIGLCQGGWMALIYAARFPGKVRRLILAGAPVDTCAGESVISALAQRTPMSVFAELVRLGGGRLVGKQMLELWGSTAGAEQPAQVLQLTANENPAKADELERRFREWYARTLDLPGTYYLQVVSWLFKENRIVDGRFVALGRAVNLADVDIPICLIAARDDALVSVPQLMALTRRVTTPVGAIESIVAPCGHLGLFVGAQTLLRVWTRAARWLRREIYDPRQA
jgi:poly(3-hydroxyalkanoate) synthetase